MRLPAWPAPLPGRSTCLAAFLTFLVGAAFPDAAPGEEARPPNLVLIFCDDLGYGDLGSYGARGYETPNLDGMAREGVRFTDFYATSPVCSASRAALLTGCYHERVGIRGALGPRGGTGLSHAETTLAELLKQRGYATGMAGKWHLGSHPSQRPTRHGFDEFLGLPYSADMWPRHPEAPNAYPPLPLIDGDRIAIADVTPEDQSRFTERFTERAVSFIRRHRDRPFFFYLAPNMPHVPLFAGEKFRGKTERGLYGDVIAEIDWSVGQILRTLKETGLDDRTLVVFTSDNGPWLSYGDHGGSAGPLREGKGTCYEGGVREPMIARWPGRIPPGRVCREPASTIDVLPTIAALAGARLPDRPIDGKDIRPLLFGEPGARSPHDALFFQYLNGQLQAMRSGRWKLLFPHTARTMIGQAAGKGGVPGKYAQLAVGLELYDLESDIGETTNLAERKPEIVRQLEEKAERFREELGDSLQKRAGKAVRPPDRVSD
ncbi:MAG: sulfatase [Paludisphaera borealis]|uniref:sulfatase family protein n=1 Tax=Paludisphaera borealis TaxID=1387353 RepID=UPI002849EEBE|nr:sulfatase [Paludisphaera borealis]MDR3621464.1 sulfatase [Paludisphaera borealis]